MDESTRREVCRHCGERCGPAWGLCPACGASGERPVRGEWAVVLERAPQGSVGALAAVLRSSGLIPGRLLETHGHRAIARLPRVLVEGVGEPTARRIQVRCAAQGLEVGLRWPGGGPVLLRRVARRLLPALARLPEHVEAPLLPEELVRRYRYTLGHLRVPVVRRDLCRLVEHVLVLQAAARRAPAAMQVLLEGPRRSALLLVWRGIELAEAAQTAQDRRALIDVAGLRSAIGELRRRVVREPALAGELAARIREKEAALEHALGHAVVLEGVQDAAAGRLGFLAGALELARAQVLAAGVTLPAGLFDELRRFTGGTEVAATVARELLAREDGE